MTRTFSSRKQWTFIGVSLLMAASLLVSAFAPAPTPTQAAAPPPATVTIKAIMMQGGGWVGVTRQLIPDFAAKTGINVEIEEQPYGSLKDKAILEMSTKTGAYDIVVLDTAWLAEFAEAGYVADLTPLIDKYKTPVDGYLPPQAQACVHNGKYYALPFEIDTRVLGVNMEMAKAAGIQEPPKTVDEFANDAILMTFDKNGKNPKDAGFDKDNIVQYGFVHTGQSGPYIALDFAPFMWGMGGDILKENGPKDYTVVLDSPETAAALTMYTELLTKWHASPPASTTFEENQQEEVIRLGKGAMGILPSPSHAAHLNGSLGFEDTKVKDQMKYVPTPANPPNKPKTRTGIWAMFIPADSKNVDEAFQFAQWITTDKDATVKYASLGGASPWQAAWTDPAVTKLFPFLPDVMQVMLVSWAEPPIPEWGQIRQIFGEMASEALTQQKTPELAIKDAAERMKQVLKDAGYPNP
jgi:ABC-type glycerol-3-phosphate transport system substrate-binding protein